LEQRGEQLAPGTVLVIDEASMVGTRDLARIATHIDRAGGSIKLIGDPDQHTSVDTGGVFKALAARGDAGVVRLVDNRRQVDPAERAAIDDYRRGEIDTALDRYDAAGRLVREQTATATYDALVGDWWADRQAGSTAPMLAGTNAARRALNARARAVLKDEGVLSGETLAAHGREFMVGDEVIARRNDRTLHSSDPTAFVKNGSTGQVTGIEHEHGEIEVAFANEGTIRIPSEYLAAGHLEHSYARTTYAVQGSTLDRARYHPSDASRFEEGYVAITRATNATSLYVVEGEIEFDDEADSHAVEPPETGLATVTDALHRRSDQKLAVETDPRAVEAARLAQRHTLRDLNERRRQLDDVLRNQPSDVAAELAEAKRTAAALRERRARLGGEKPGLKPSRRHQLANTVATLDRSIENAEGRIADLEERQATHDAFAAAHEHEFAERKLVALAASARRLRVRIEAIAGPTRAVVDLIGSRPTGQRERLAWDRAAEAVALHLDETGRAMPANAVALADVLGPRPTEPLARFDRDRVVAAVRQAQGSGRSVGQSRGIG
ncbi:MAG: AAA family ATPase, partial [Actinomycetota bacterium]|nr:AAA family ATPase [Actinomycetota bacterium]